MTHDGRHTSECLECEEFRARIKSMRAQGFTLAEAVAYEAWAEHLCLEMDEEEANLNA